MIRCFLMFAAIVAAGPSFAQQKVQTVHAGKPTIVYTWADCQGRRQIAVSVKAEVGVVVVRETTINRCGQINLPAYVATYTAPSGFRGPATIWLYPPNGSPVDHKVVVIE